MRCNLRLERVVIPVPRMAPAMLSCEVNQGHDTADSRTFHGSVRNKDGAARLVQRVGRGPRDGRRDGRGAHAQRERGATRGSCASQIPLKPAEATAAAPAPRTSVCAVGVLAGRPASSGYATDRILVLREQLRRLEVELASAHQGLRQAYKELDDADRAWRRQLRTPRTRRDSRGELWLQAGDAIDHE